MLVYLKKIGLNKGGVVTFNSTMVGKLMVMNPSISFFVCVSSVGMMFPETVLVY